MSELAVTLLRLSYLALLWVFVFAALAVLRRDLWSATRVTTRGPGRRTTDKTRQPRGRTVPATATTAGLGATPAATAPPQAPVPSPVRTAPQRQSITRAPSRLVVTAGKMAGTSLPLGRSAIVIGRAPSCTLVVDDDYVSSRHARVFPENDQWYVEDLGSTNGTLLNGERISEPQPFAPGMQVRLGQTVLELRR